jgi:ABC-type branched-subunit amino acid transport system substrate-binding protein
MINLNTSRRRVLGILGVAIGASVLGSKRRAWAAETANIGTLCPLTGAGSSLGGTMEEAVRRQIERINKEGGVGGFTFAGFHENSETDPNAAVVAAKKLIEVNNVSAILGEWASGETLAVGPLCIANKVVQFTSGGDDKIVDQPHNGYIFRTEPGGVLWGKAFAEAAWDLGFRRAAPSAVQASFAIAYSANFQKYFKEKGGQIVSEPVVYAASATSYRAELDKLLANDPDVVFAMGYTPDTVILIKDAYRAGSKAKWLVPGYVGLDPELIKAVGPEAAASVITVDPSTPKTAESTKDYLALMGDEKKLNAYAAQTFDQMALVALAIEQQKKSDGTAIRDGIRAVTKSGNKVVKTLAEGLKELRQGNSVKYEGLSSPLDFDEKGSIQSTHFTTFQFQDAGFKPGSEKLVRI